MAPVVVTPDYEDREGRQNRVTGAGWKDAEGGGALPVARAMFIDQHACRESTKSSPPVPHVGGGSSV